MNKVCSEVRLLDANLLLKMSKSLLSPIDNNALMIIPYGTMLLA